MIDAVSTITAYNVDEYSKSKTPSQSRERLLARLRKIRVILEKMEACKSVEENVSWNTIRQWIPKELREKEEMFQCDSGPDEEKRSFKVVVRDLRVKKQLFDELD